MEIVLGDNEKSLQKKPLPFWRGFYLLHIFYRNLTLEGSFLFVLYNNKTIQFFPKKVHFGA
jgi:hypothetical protein